MTSLTAPGTVRSRFFQLKQARQLDRWLNAMPHPSLVIEIAANRVAAVRWNGEHLDTVAVEPLAAGAIMPSPVENNVTQPEAVSAALQVVLRRVATRETPLTLLIPDPVVRVFILPFDSLPRRGDDALPLLRWRLKKSVPFDMDETVVSWMRQSGRENNLEVVTAVARQRIIREYEQIVETVVGKPIVVLSSTLSTLPLLEERGATLLVRMCGKTMTTAITTGATLCVYRATEMTSEAGLLDPQVTLDEVFPAIAYYQDSWESGVDRVRIAGFGSRESVFSDALSQELKVPVARLADAESARLLDSSARDLIYQDLDATVGWMLNGEA